MLLSLAQRSEPASEASDSNAPYNTKLPSQSPIAIWEQLFDASRSMYAHVTSICWITGALEARNLRISDLKSPVLTLSPENDTATQFLHVRKKVLFWEQTRFGERLRENNVLDWFFPTSARSHSAHGAISLKVRYFSGLNVSENPPLCRACKALLVFEGDNPPIPCESHVPHLGAFEC